MPDELQDYAVVYGLMSKSAGNVVLIDCWEWGYAFMKAGLLPKGCVWLCLAVSRPG